MDSGRRSHRKSRKGCVQCKRRKIKCDESKPVCNNCLRHKAACLYQDLSSTSSRTAQHTPPEELTPKQEAGFAESNHGSELESTVSGPNSTALSYSMLEMELLHAYTTYTSLTFENDPVVQAVYRIYTPQVAFQHPFVMDAIIAITALHRAASRPAEKDFYTSFAARHHERGLQQAATHLANVNRDNCIAVYLFSIFTGKISFASPKRPGDWLVVGQHGVADWLRIFRGTMMIISTYIDTLLASEVGPMLTNGIRRRIVWESSSTGEHKPMEALLGRLERFVTDKPTMDVYKDAIRTLEKSFSLLPNTHAEHREPTDAYIWFFEVSEEYLHLLYSKSQEAMAIFSFWVALLKSMEYSWFMEGWGVHLISVIWKTLDHEHRMWIQWPVEQIGWIPN